MIATKQIGPKPKQPSLWDKLQLNPEVCPVCDSGNLPQTEVERTARTPGKCLDCGVHWEKRSSGLKCHW